MKNIKFYKKQKGQIIVLATFGLIPLVLLIALVFNTGEHVSSKIQTQNAADAAAMTQATWAARSLNVMSINNTALSQSYSVTMVGYMVAAVVQEAGVLIVKEIKEIVQEAKRCHDIALAAAAASGGVGYAPALAVCLAIESVPQRAVHMGNEVLPRWFAIAEDLGYGDVSTGVIQPHKITDFHDITQALSAMNDEIVNSFPEFSQQVAKRVAEVNGVSDVPRFYSGYESDDSLVSSKDYKTTGLPVKNSELIGGALKSAFGIGPLKSVSEKGTHSTTFIKRFQDFIIHGYKEGEGPYDVAYEQSAEEVGKLIDGLEQDILYLWEIPVGQGPKEKFKRTFEDHEDICWNPHSSLHMLPLIEFGGLGCTLPLPDISDRLSIYEIEQDYLTEVAGASVWTDEDVTSILAFIRDKRDSGAIISSRFNSPTAGEYAYAQAQIYNDKHPDLYTHNWRAVLRPSTLLESDKDNKRNNALIVIKGAEGFPEFYDLLSSLTAQQHKGLNAH